MDIYQSIIEYLSTIPVIDSWLELKGSLERVASHRPRAWGLPGIACQAVGGSIEQAVPASAAIACMQVNIILVDDMLDKDPRGEYHRIGEAQAANNACAFQAAGMEALFSGEFSPDVKIAMLDSINRMMLKTTFGQYLDVQNPQDEAAYWRIVDNKSTPFFEAALHIGAVAGGASDDVSAKIRRVGYLYGEMIQIHDDLNDTMAVPANPDWVQGRSPLPILFARVVDHPSRPRFLELCRDISQADALQEAQGILIRCGAVSYCVDRLLQRYHAAQELLGSITLERREVLDNLLEEVITPVRKLFQSLGKSFPEFPLPRKGKSEE